MQRRGRPVRGFFAGLLLGIFLSLDLALMGAVKLDSAVLDDPARRARGARPDPRLVGAARPRREAAPKPAAAPLRPPVAWPESAPVEGSTAAAPRRAGTRADRRPPPRSSPPPTSIDLTARRRHAGMRGPWTSTTHPKKPPGARSAATGSRPTPRRSPAPNGDESSMFEPGGDDYLERAPSAGRR